MLGFIHTKTVLSVMQREEENEATMRINWFTLPGN